MNLLDAGIRADLARAHETTIAQLGEAGTWLRSSEKLAIDRMAAMEQVCLTPRRLHQDLSSAG